MIDDITAYKDLGIGAVSMIIFYSFSRYVSDRALTQVEEANKRATDSQQSFLAFIENSYKENTKTMTGLVESFKEHINTKERALDMLEENMKKLEEKFGRN